MEYIIGVFVMILLDIISGLLKAIKSGNVKSSIMKEGLLSKASEVFVMVMALIIDKGAPYLGVNLNLPLLQCIGIYICIMELFSIIENIGALNPALAKKLQNIFHDFSENTEEE